VISPIPRDSKLVVLLPVFYITHVTVTPVLVILMVIHYTRVRSNLCYDFLEYFFARISFPFSAVL